MTEPETRPVVDRPDSVTHWTCPKAPSPDMTHHLVDRSGTVRCAYCKRTAGELRAEQLDATIAAFVAKHGRAPRFGELRDYPGMNGVPLR